MLVGGRRRGELHGRHRNPRLINSMQVGDQMVEVRKIPMGKGGTSVSSSHCFNSAGYSQEVKESLTTESSTVGVAATRVSLDSTHRPADHQSVWLKLNSLSPSSQRLAILAIEGTPFNHVGLDIMTVCLDTCASAVAP